MMKSSGFMGIDPLERLIAPDQLPAIIDIRTFIQLIA
jgi:hypothetical protein